jgi:hypothetical protein
MDEQVTNKANEVLLKMLEGIDKGAEFVAAKAPEVVQQLLTWNMVYSAGEFIVSISILVVGILIIKKLIKCIIEDTDIHDIVMCCIVGLIPLAFWIAAIVSTFNIIWLKILVAPDLFLLEYAATLIR